MLNIMYYYECIQHTLLSIHTHAPTCLLVLYVLYVLILPYYTEVEAYTKLLV